MSGDSKWGGPNASGKVGDERARELAMEGARRAVEAHAGMKVVEISAEIADGGVSVSLRVRQPCLVEAYTAALADLASGEWAGADGDLDCRICTVKGPEDATMPVKTLVPRDALVFAV